MKTLFGPKTWIVYVTGFVIGLILTFYRVSYGVGFLIGFLISILNMILIESFINRIFAQKIYRPFPGYLLYLLRSSFLFIPFVMALKWPEIVNVFTAVAGILFYKFILFASVLMPKKGA